VKPNAVKNNTNVKSKDSTVSIKPINEATQIVRIVVIFVFIVVVFSIINLNA
jgi:hypothetical protein